ncbi:hypothetical protein Sjap_020111 [Stephania japonica]|uniref:BP28 C-terminal domain-containing protein n=1 Tax=Stephania japonica TaxID=461633 RepID=A0AAP0F5L4_9MAGN
MSGSIASQLRAIKSFIQVEAEPPSKRPFTRPSIIFDPKEAADIDLHTILSIAQSGLEVLVQNDNRFGGYKNSLFSDKSREVDRELLGVEENNKINDSINSYLRLLSGYLHFPSSLKTLEYLFRRYKIHIYNVDELILCALPNHETHAFVRILQLLEFGNSKWKFLEGVKVSGAPPPMRVIVQQCIRDMGVLDTLCTYATPIKKYRPSAPVIGFFTSVVVEILGALPLIDDDTVRRILPYVFSGLEPTSRGGIDHKAGALMIIVLLAHRVALAPKAVKAMIESIARVARHDTKELFDLQWLRMLLMALISLVQSQSIEMLPKKGLEILVEVRDFAEVVLGLSKEFNIKRFLSVYLESLANYSSSDDFCRSALISAIRTLPVDDFIFNVVNKVLTSCVALSRRVESSELFESGCWAKQIFCIIDEIYPGQLRGAFHKFLEESKMNDIGDSVFETLSLMIDGGLDFSADISKSKFWLSLEHPNAVVRRASLSRLASSDVLEATFTDFQRNAAFQDVMLRALHDEDLGIVKLVLSLHGLSKVMDTPILFGALHDLLLRCINSVLTGKPAVSTSEVCDVAVSCLDFMISNFNDQIDFSKRLATVMFPLLLVLPKSWKLNIKALQLAEEIRWPFYHNISGDPPFFLKQPSFPGNRKESVSTSINMRTIETMAETFAKSPEEYLLWLIECSIDFELSKTLFFLVTLQSLIVKREELGAFAPLFRACFPVLKQAWRDFELSGDCLLMKELTVEKLDADCTRFISQLSNPNLKVMNGELLITIFWRLMKATVSLNDLCENQEWVCAVDELFILFAASPLKIYVKEHLHLLVTKCRITPVVFLSKFYTEEGFSVAVQIESLLCYARLCSQSTFSEKSIRSSDMQLLLNFPSVLVPISSKDQDVRVAAMKCIEGIYNLWHHNNTFGSDTVAAYSIWTPCLGEFLGLLREHQTLIISDQDFLPSFLTIVLGSSCSSLLAPQNLDKRFDQHKKEAISLFILSSALKLSAYGKFKVLALFKEMGGNVMRVEGVKSFLFELLERRVNHHIGLVQSCQPLSNVESDTLCLLLVLCLTLSSDYSPVPCHIEKSMETYVSRGFIEQSKQSSSNDPTHIQAAITNLGKMRGANFKMFKNDEDEQMIYQKRLYERSHNNVENRVACDEGIERIKMKNGSAIKLEIHCIAFEEDSDVGTFFLGMGPPPLVWNRTDSLSELMFWLWIILWECIIGNLGSLFHPLLFILMKLTSPCPVQSSMVMVTLQPQDLDTLDQDQQSSIQILASTSVFLQSKDLVSHEIICFNLVDFSISATSILIRDHTYSLKVTLAEASLTMVAAGIFMTFTMEGSSSLFQFFYNFIAVWEALISMLFTTWSVTIFLIKDNLLQMLVILLLGFSTNRRMYWMINLMRKIGAKTLCSLLDLLLLKKNIESSINITSFNLYINISIIILCRKGHYLITFLSSTIVVVMDMMLYAYYINHQATITKFMPDKIMDHIIDILIILGEAAVLQNGISLAKAGLPILTKKTKKKKRTINEVNRVLVVVVYPSLNSKGMISELKHDSKIAKKSELNALSTTFITQNPKFRLLSQAFLRTHKEKYKEHTHQLENQSCNHLSKLVEKKCFVVDDATDGWKQTSAKSSSDKTIIALYNIFYSLNTVNIYNIFDSRNMRNIVSMEGIISEHWLWWCGKQIDPLGPCSMVFLSFLCVYILECSPNLDLKTNLFGLTLEVPKKIEVVVACICPPLNRYCIVILFIILLKRFSSLVFNAYVFAYCAAISKLVIEHQLVKVILSMILLIPSNAITSRLLSLLALKEMLGKSLGRMKWSDVISDHLICFEIALLMLALDRVRPSTLEALNLFFLSLNSAFVLLCLGLSHLGFCFLVNRNIDIVEHDWAESESGYLDKNISFYKLINALADHHRSLFVPYFKYLLEDCKRHLTDEEEAKSVDLVHNRKKARTDISNIDKKKGRALSLDQWHLRALIISSLQKCFVYDTGSQKFLDSSNFQANNRNGNVSKLVVEAPASIDESEDVPSVKEVDDSLVSCLGQMAVTAGSDLLWKPLNHEVLMQTRSEKVRARILGLRVIKYLVEHLKEEYLVLLEETIRTLGELLEDVELPVKTLAQEIVKEMEEVSGEIFRRFF